MAGRRAQELLDYWFGPDPLDPGRLSERFRFWFGAGEPAELRALHDADVTARWGQLAASAAAGELDAWAATPHRRLALILLLDQVPRHAHRGTAAAFEQDWRALGLCLEGMAAGADATLSPAHRLFFYLPLQHAESREAQEESLAAYRRLLAEAPEAVRSVFADCLRYAELHHGIIARFGRFPHRNAALGRADTPDERAFLEDDDAPRFGQ